MNQKMKGTVSLFLATTIWGTAFIAQSVGMDHIGPFTFQAVRCFLAVPALLILVWISDRIGRKPFLSPWKDPHLWAGGVLCGIPLFLACNLQQVGLMGTTTGKCAFLTAMYVVIVPVLGIFLKRKPGKFIWLSVLLAVVGMYLLSCLGETGFTVWDLTVLGCALMFAVQILCVEHFSKTVDALRLNTVQVLVCAALSAVCTLCWERPSLQGIWDARISLVYAGVMSMGIAYSLQIVGQKSLESSVASLIMSLEAVVAAIFGWILLDQKMALPEIVGSILMLAAVVIAQLPETNKAKDRAA